MSDGSRAARLRRLLRPGVPLVLLAALAAVPFAAGLRIDNRIELWLDPSGPTAATYERFRSSFGSDEFVLIAYEGRDVFAPDALDVQELVLERLAETVFVTQVTGLPSLRSQLFTGRSPEEFRQGLRRTPFYERFLLGEGDGIAGLFVETALPPRPGARRQLLDGIRAAIAPLEQIGFAVHVVGPPALNVALDETSAFEAARSFPLALAASVIVLWLLFRCWRATAVACICAATSILLTLGLIGALDRPLNMVSSVLPSLLWVLALAAGIHLLQRYRSHRRGLGSASEALLPALAEVAPPCALASVTTALGFASLLSADMAPIRELGGFAAAGLLVSLFVNLSLGPWLIERLDVPGDAGARASSARFERLGRFSTRHAGAVVALSLGATGTALLGCFALQVEADPLSFLPADSPAVRAYESVGERLTGYYSLELVIETASGWLDPGAWPAIDRVAAELEAQPGVARVLSPLDLLRQLHHQERSREPEAYVLPADASEAARLVEDYDPFGRGARSGLVSEDGRSVRLSALVRVMPSGAFLTIRERAEHALASLPPRLSGYTTGIVAQLVDAQLALVRTQLRSFGLAFATVFVCLCLGLRSLRLTALSILPNVLPILAALAAMALFRIPLDAATVMMASVALGIAVDDTVHLLHAVRRERRSGRTAASASQRALGEVGPALVMTTATACIGFLALTLSAFVPIRLFGALSALALGVALLADLLLVPALLVRVRWGGAS